VTRFFSDLTVVGDQSGRDLDIGFGRGHLRRITEAEHATQILLRQSGSDLAGRGTD
jgi:ribosomal protein S5